MLVATAWFVKESAFVTEHAGESAVRLTVGIAAFSVLLGTKVPVGLWPARLKRERFSWGPALLLGTVGAALIALAGRGGVAEGQWAADRGGVLLVVVGAAFWTAILGVSKFPREKLWLALAIIGGSLPAITSLWLVRIEDPMVVSADGNSLVAAVGFFAVAGIASALVTDELAFRRLLVGRTGGVGLMMVALGAFVYGIWNTFLPAESGGLLAAFGLGFARGIIAGALYVLSRSLLVSSVFTGLTIAGTTGVVMALREGGTGAETVADFADGAMTLTFLVAAGMAWLLYRTRGPGGMGEYQVTADVINS